MLVHIFVDIWCTYFTDIWFVFHGHLVYLWPFGIFYGHLVYFMDIWYMYFMDIWYIWW
jgi:hypothetical protein